MWRRWRWRFRVYLDERMREDGEEWRDVEGGERMIDDTEGGRENIHRYDKSSLSIKRKFNHEFNTGQLNKRIDNDSHLPFRNRLQFAVVL